MRRAILSAAVLGVALMLQLTVVNRLPLPGAGAPDLVLLTVVALGLCGGPAAGALTGFCAGLALDIAPPGSYLIGQYALVFCLVGYLCGRLRGIANRSALLTIAAAMAAAATGEALSAAFGLAVSNPQVTWPAVRQVLPSSIVYDVVLAPFVLYLVVRAVRLAGGLGRDAAAQPADGAALLARNQAAGSVLPGGSLQRRGRARRCRAAGRGRLGVRPGGISPVPGPARAPHGRPRGSGAACSAHAPAGRCRGPARRRMARQRAADGAVGVADACGPARPAAPAAARCRDRGLRGRAPGPAPAASSGQPAAGRGQPP